MGATQTEEAHGTTRLAAEDVAWRAIRIRKPLDEVRKAWLESGLPGRPEFKAAPGDRGSELNVTIDEDPGEEALHILSPYEGGSTAQQLESALRALKARIETGEIATTIGQPTGNEGRSR